MFRSWTWGAIIIIIAFVVLSIWWASTSTCEGLAYLDEDFPDPSNRMCRCMPAPFPTYRCELHGLKKVRCKDFDLEGRNTYCCTSDLEGCKNIACSVPY